MDLKEEIYDYAKKITASIKEKKGIYSLSVIIAQRKVFLSTKKLEYQAQFRINEDAKEVIFTERLKESGAGMDAGAGFKTETYNTFKKPREGSIHEQSELFGKSYTYTFDFHSIRSNIEEITKKYGFNFKYQITSQGL